MNMSHTTVKGDIGELMFSAACLDNEILPSKPIGTYRYDIITEFKGKMYRVQVKSSGVSRQLKGGESVRWNIGSGYTSNEVDFFALVYTTEGLIYIVPTSLVERIEGNKFYINIRGNSPHYNNWNLLKQ